MTSPGQESTPPTTRWATTDAPRGDAYDARWEQLAAAGHDPHGEATFVERFRPTSVLDAGCGTGRVARELARRGVRAMGVDVDPAMLATAKTKSPELSWLCADLATLDLHGQATTPAPPFDAVVLAGNVMIFVEPGTEGTVLARLAHHLVIDGLLIAGFQLQPGQLDLATYDALAAEAGLVLDERWATWSCDPFDASRATYAVSVHRKRPE